MNKKILIIFLIATVAVSAVVLIAQKSQQEGISKQELLQKFQTLKAQYEQAKAQGIDVSEPERLGREAKRTFDKGDYKRTNELLKEAESLLKKIETTKTPSSTTMPETCPDCKKEEKLLSFLREYFNDPNFSPIEVVKGKLDKHLDEEMVLVFCKEYGSDKWLIVKEKPEGYVVDKEGEFGDPERGLFEYFIEARKIISDQPKIFITKSYPRVGTCVPAGKDLNIYRLENEEFKKIWHSQISYTGELTNETGIGTGKVEVIETGIEFKDLDKDGNSEIIKNGTKKLCKGSCYDCDKIIKEEKIYQTFKWSPQKESFIKTE